MRQERHLWNWKVQKEGVGLHRWYVNWAHVFIKGRKSAWFESQLLRCFTKHVQKKNHLDHVSLPWEMEAHWLPETDGQRERSKSTQKMLSVWIADEIEELTWDELRGSRQKRRREEKGIKRKLKCWKFLTFPINLDTCNLAVWIWHLQAFHPSPPSSSVGCCFSEVNNYLLAVTR